MNESMLAQPESPPVADRTTSGIRSLAALLHTLDRARSGDPVPAFRDDDPDTLTSVLWAGRAYRAVLHPELTDLARHRASQATARALESRLRPGRDPIDVDRLARTVAPIAVSTFLGTLDGTRGTGTSAELAAMAAERRRAAEEAVDAYLRTREPLPEINAGNPELHELMSADGDRDDLIALLLAFVADTRLDGAR